MQISKINTVKTNFGMAWKQGEYEKVDNLIKDEYKSEKNRVFTRHFVNRLEKKKDYDFALFKTDKPLEKYEIRAYLSPKGAWSPKYLDYYKDGVVLAKGQTLYEVLSRADLSIDNSD